LRLDASSSRAKGTANTVLRVQGFQNASLGIPICGGVAGWGTSVTDPKRVGELRGAEWSELDPPNAEWRIPAARMTMGEPHIVPLARQALAILRELQPFARGGHYPRLQL
jgi:hypothetical protein